MKKILLIIILLLAGYIMSKPIIFHTYDIYKGTNYISFSKTTAETFDEIFTPGSYEIFYYDNPTSQWVACSGSDQSVCGRGYRVTTTYTADISYTGTTCSVSVADLEAATVASGWHLIAPGDTNLNIVGSTLEDLGGISEKEFRVERAYFGYRS